VVNNDNLYTVDGNDASHILVDDFKNGQQLEDFDTGGVGTILLDSFGDEILAYRIHQGYEVINTKTGSVFKIPIEKPDQGTNRVATYIIASRMNELTALNDKIIVLEEKDEDGSPLNKFYIYDRIKNKIVSFSDLPLKISEIDLDGNRICFNLYPPRLEVYCFDYDSDNSYVIPVFSNFNSKVVGGYDFVNNDDDPMDDMGPGTHVAATAAGNGILKGVAPDAKIYAYKVLDAGGSGSYSNIISAIERSIDPNQDGDFSDHLDIISLSLGGWGDPDDPMSQAIDNAVSAGVVAVVAAGNSGPDENTIGSPGTARKAITVGAIDKFDNIAWFSSRGPVIWTDIEGNTKSLMKPDVVAPGVDICAAYAKEISIWDNRKCLDNTHVAISGTSMATPHVAGAVALILQKHPDWTPEEIKMALRNTATDLIPMHFNENLNTQGTGKINVLNAVQLSNPPCMAEIETNGEVSGIINIKGSAYCENFNSYKLFYEVGENPRDWIEIVSSQQPITNDLLKQSFDTTNFNDGKYLLKLEVTNIAGSTSTDYSTLLTKNLYIESIGNSLNYIKGKGLIKGQIKITDYDSFKVQYLSGCDEFGRWTDQNVISSNSVNEWQDIYSSQIKPY